MGVGAGAGKSWEKVEFTLHLELPGRLKKPGAQLRHCALPSREYVLLAHTVQKLDPGTGAKLPSSQGLQSALPGLGALRPVGQRTQKPY